MSEDSLETLKVVIKASSKPLQEEMKKVRQSMNTSSKAVSEYQKQVKKQMDEQMAPMRKVKEQMNKIKEAIRASYNMPNRSGGMKNMQRDVDSTEKKLRKLISTRNEMENSGGDIEFTAEYKEIAKAVDVAEKKLNSLIARQDKMKATGAKQNTSSWKRLQYDIQEADDSLKAMKMDMDNLANSEKFQNTSGYTKVCADIKATREELAQLSAQQYEYEKSSTKITRSSKAFDALKKVLHSTTNAIKRTGGAFASLIHRFSTGIPHFGRAQKSMNRLGRTGKGLGGILQTLGMTARFMFASFMIMGSINQAKEGLQNLAKYSNQAGTQFNKSATAMYSSLKQLQNGLATAFEPIVNIVAPYMTRLIGYLTDGANAVAQFLSAITGSTTWTKATYNTQNYADSLDSAAGSAKELNRQLYSFDEINKASSSSAGSSAGTGVAAGDMFTTEKINTQFANFAQMVKDAWKDADFTGIGNMVGQKLKKELDGIKWDDIKKSCNKIAKSVGTFINGFISTNGLDKSIGKTIGNAINTAVGTANTFFKTTNFLKLGGFIASTANSTIETTDFGLLGETVANGLLAGINTWYGFVTTFNFDQLGTKISDSIKRFFTTMGHTTYDPQTKTQMNGWQRMGTALGKSLSGIADTIVTALDDVPWSKVRTAIKDFIEATVKNLDINVGKVTLAITGFFLAKGTLSLIGTALKTAILTKLTGAFTGAGAAATTGTGGATIASSASTIGTFFGKAFVLGTAAYITQKLMDSIGKAVTGDKSWTAGGALEKFITGIPSAVGNFFTGKGDGSLSGWLDSWLDLNGVDKSSVSVKKRFKNLKKIITDFFDMNPKNKLEVSVDADKNSSKRVYSTLQDGLKGYSLSTEAKTSNSGWSIWKDLQNGVGNNKGFGSGILSTIAKASNSGWSIWRELQYGTATSKGFNAAEYHTGAKADNSGSSIRDGLQKTFGLKSLFTAARLTTSGTELNKDTQATFGLKNLTTGIDLPTGASAWTQFSTQWNSSKNPLTLDLTIAKPTTSLLTGKASGGLYSGGSWKSITAYASGGTPSSAQLFMAREAGPELVGTIGNHTAVVNNDQIVSSVASGVYGAVVNAMSKVMMTFRGGSDTGSKQPVVIPIYLDGKELARVTFSNYEQMVRSGQIKPVY